MPTKNNTNNKEIVMEKNIFPILVVNNTKLKPYIEVFDYYPENVTKKPLGNLTGFFEVREYSEDSAYIVNFLNSVAKKEYYLNPKRAVNESFDSTLHKINLALSEVAKHGNVNWLGKIDSAICAFEKNSLHFTVTGGAKILLWRKGVLTDITEGLAPENPEPHPLKTFVNVSSGRLEKNDKLIITSGDLFNILSISDIGKNLKRFNGDKFSQFIKTAITNELDLAGTIIVDINEPEKKTLKKTSPLNEKQSEPMNVFSGKSFDRKKEKAASMINKSNQESYANKEVAAENEYTDKKTGHIYIQGKDGETNESSAISEQAQVAKEVFQDMAHSLKFFFARQFLLLWKKIKIAFSVIGSYDYAKKLSSLKKSSSKQSIIEKEIDLEDTLEEILLENSDDGKPNYPVDIVSDSDYVDGEATSFSIKETFYSLFFKYKLWIKKTKIKLNSNKNNSPLRSVSRKRNWIFPQLGKISTLFSRFSKIQRIFSLVIIALIIIIPLMLTRISLEKETPASISLTDSVEPLEEEKLLREKNIVFIDQAEKISSIQNGINIFSLKQGLFYITDNKVVLKLNEEDEEFIWPSEYGSARVSTYMNDLGLIFIVTDQQKILSFSPVSKDFKDNAISFPENLEIEIISTYLTYLYVVDKKENQIYRYPRAEGGFGPKNDWLNEDLKLSNASSMSIDENLYLASKSDFRKMFRGKTEEFSLEKSETAISYDIMHTDTQTSNIYILDNENSRLIQFTKEGSIVKQYHHEVIQGAKGFAIDETNKKAYIISSSDLVAISL